VAVAVGRVAVAVAVAVGRVAVAVAVAVAAAAAVALRCLAVWVQREIVLEPLPRGYHLITREVLGALPELAQLNVGLLHLFLRHTSASLTLNENASPDVRRDFASYFDHAVPEDAAYWTHRLEGPDDMPAHIKTSLLGPSLSLPIAGGRLALGTWQGIYLCEHRDRGGPRSLLATAWGETAG
jgi:secondary thiamine-phosphate synthase enzyme